jgi:hypothetical protein
MFLPNNLNHAARYASLFLLALNTGYSVPVIAAQPASYDVEIVVFAYRNMAANGEQWSTAVPQKSASAGHYNDGQVQELPVGAYQLNSISNGLRQSSSYSVLFHRAWRQPAYAEANAVDLPVHAVATSGNNTIEGSVRLIRERFLHLDADLLMMSTGNYNPVMDVNTAPAARVYSLQEKRRIKSKVTHYFDHPAFGMIARVTPYYSPEESLQLEQADQPEVIEEEMPLTAPLADDQLTR